MGNEVSLIYKAWRIFDYILTLLPSSIFRIYIKLPLFLWIIPVLYMYNIFIHVLLFYTIFTTTHVYTHQYKYTLHPHIHSSRHFKLSSHNSKFEFQKTISYIHQTWLNFQIQMHSCLYFIYQMYLCLCCNDF